MNHSAHHHSHSEHSSHQQVTQDSQRRVFWVMLLTGGFMLVEVFGGLYSGSLALLADAGHMLSDSGALALAWLAFMLSSRRPDNKRTYGYPRFQILAALVNGLVLFFLAGWILVEAWQRFAQPTPVMGVPMLLVAAIGFMVNLIAFRVLHQGHNHNVNMRGALLHVIGDLLGSAAAIIAAIVILITGWYPIDPLLSALVALLILRSAWFLLRETWHILMEGTPEGIEPTAIQRAIETGVVDVINVHHLHVWALTQEQPLITLHISMATNANHQQTLRNVQTLLAEQFGLTHATIQLEYGNCPETEDCHCG